ncbi:MAG: hypothetical protein GY832_32695 [Chloroflexi bacterium]|nr:hypothetical protein [Chloroflexota bacterium]
MVLEKHSKAFGLSVAVTITVLTMTVACSSAPNAPSITSKAPGVTPTLGNIWADLLQQTPYPYTTPLPPAQPSNVDGTYAKFDPREGTRPFCIRCMPYPAEGGVWLLQLDKGIFRIFSKRSLNGWHSMGSFTASDDQITLFNDPNCHDTIGTYAWKLEEGQLAIDVIQDECADGWRAKIFTNYSWASCQPPGAEAAITQHWPAPDGCYPLE